jgi:hypothetical protein
MTKEEALNFVLHAADYSIKPNSPVEEGLCPMFYMTLTAEGDRELVEKFKLARTILRKEFGLE